MQLDSKGGLHTQISIQDIEKFKILSHNVENSILEMRNIPHTLRFRRAHWPLLPLIHLCHLAPVGFAVKNIGIEIVHESLFQQHPPWHRYPQCLLVSYHHRLITHAHCNPLKTRGSRQDMHLLVAQTRHPMYQLL